MLEDAKSVTVHHRQKLQNVAWVISFCRRQLAALVCLRMLMTLIVGLREDGRGRHREAAGVRREHRSPAGVKGTQHRRRGEGLLQSLKTSLCLGVPHEAGRWATQRGQWGGDLGIPLDEPAIVVRKSKSDQQPSTRGAPLPSK